MQRSWQSIGKRVLISVLFVIAVVLLTSIFLFSFSDLLATHTL